MLVRKLWRSGYFALDDSYELQTATDNPSAVSAVRLNGTYKEIRHYYGDWTAPVFLKRLEFEIDDVSGSARWIGWNLALTRDSWLSEYNERDRKKVVIQANVETHRLQHERQKAERRRAEFSSGFPI